MKYLGIDPGAEGAIAVLDDDGRLVAVADMPTIELRVGKTNRERVSPAGLRTLLLEHADCTICAVEKVGGMTGQSASASFTFGYACGLLEGVLAALLMPVAPVTPQAWKKSAGIAAGKGAAREAAMRTWPAQAHLFARKKDDGRAEASLIARHGWLSVPRSGA
jgi:crossover junction endodeoxyribonuclease RuvC